MRFLQFALIIIYLCLSACATHNSPPVIDRTPVKKPAPATPKSKEANTDKDWRPDTYTVKKGDTLFAIGLEFGYDYKEIAQANNISAPYPIRVGQTLNLKSLKTKEVKVTQDDDVVLTPLKSEPSTGTTTSAEPILLSEPKALREPYSAEALAATPPKATPAKPSKPIAETKTETKPEVKPEPKQASKIESKPSTDEEIEWDWPTSGKVITGFSDANNSKGIDIAGAIGQAIKAAATGKVIYSGSDLRGYGKLVIIKHSNNFLSVYAHNSQILVKEGQQVNKGQKIAEMGSTDADRVKLHFEIRKQGKSVDPAKYLAENAR